jgi:hypothetical protein
MGMVSFNNHSMVYKDKVTGIHILPLLILLPLLYSAYSSQPPIVTSYLNALKTDNKARKCTTRLRLCS